MVKPARKVQQVPPDRKAPQVLPVLMDRTVSRPL